MAQAIADITGKQLKDLFEERQGQSEFRFRNAAYKIYENCVLSRDEKGTQQTLTYRPLMLDGISTGAEEKMRLNLGRQIVRHHQAMFAKPPLIWNEPYSAETQKVADSNTEFIRSVLTRGRIKAQMPLNSYWLSCRGDFVGGVEWDEVKKTIMVKFYDPAQCYPSFDPSDPGALSDLIITAMVPRSWAEMTFGVRLDPSKQVVRWLIYWDCYRRRVSIDEMVISHLSLDHELGFVPYRWCYAEPNGRMAQSDLCDIPILQSMIGDLLQIGLDAIRRNVDKAYWGKGIKGNVAPIPGKVIGFPNPAAEINEFPNAVPPSMITDFINILQGYGQAMAGISPISAEGLAEGSIVTGSAIRHQVEAIEARAETKRSSLEEFFGVLGEYILRVLEAKFPNDHLIYRNQQTKQPESITGADIKQWYTCQAAYGGLEGLPPQDRMRVAMEALGRLIGMRTAARLAFPDRDPQELASEVEEYQLGQAVLGARAQAAAQHAGQDAQANPPQMPQAPQGAASPPSTQGPGINPQMPQPMQPPGAMMPGRVKIGDLTKLIDVIRPKLKGEVYAIGELALTGMAVKPVVAVTEENDRPLLAQVLADKAQVVVGVQEDQPKVQI